MIMDGPGGRNDAIHDALRACTTAVQKRCADQWDFELKNGQVFNGRAGVSEPWFEMAIELIKPGRDKAAPDAETLGRMLKRNSDLPDGIKIVLTPLYDLALRVDVPMGRNGNLRRQVSRACVGLKNSCSRILVGEDRSGEKMAQADLDMPPGRGLSPDLQSFLREEKWEFTEKEDGARMAVNLDVPGFQQAFINQVAPGAIRVATTLGTWDRSMPAACRHALAFLLLRTAGIVRMVRSTFLEQEKRTTLGFEIVVPVNDSTKEALEHALTALSVACRLCLKEAKALGKEHVASEYLATQCLASC